MYLQALVLHQVLDILDLERHWEALLCLQALDFHLLECDSLGHVHGKGEALGGGESILRDVEERVTPSWPPEFVCTTFFSEFVIL